VPPAEGARETVLATAAVLLDLRGVAVDEPRLRIGVEGVDDFLQTVAAEQIVIVKLDQDVPGSPGAGVSLHGANAVQVVLDNESDPIVVPLGPPTRSLVENDHPFPVRESLCDQ
jgi:hypothetical protein